MDIKLTDAAIVKKAKEAIISQLTDMSDDQLSNLWALCKGVTDHANTRDLLAFKNLDTMVGKNFVKEEVSKEITKRRPKNRQERRAVYSRLRKLNKGYVRGQTRELYLRAVKEGITIYDVLKKVLQEEGEKVTT